MRRLAVLAAALVALAGCSSTVPYAPDRAVVRSIPPEKAREALRGLLAKATPRVEGGALDAVEVGDDSFAFAAHDPSGKTFALQRYRYAALDPHAYAQNQQYVAPGFPSLFLKLTGAFGTGVGVPGSTWNPCDPSTDCVWLSAREDVETLLDALASLKADALARPRTPP